MLQAAFLHRDFASLSIITLNINIFKSVNIQTDQIFRVPSHSACPAASTACITTAQATETLRLFPSYTLSQVLEFLD